MTYHTYKIKEICEINKESYSKKDNWGFFNYLDTKNITDGKIDEIKFLNPDIDKIPSRAKRKVNNRDIIISTVRPIQRHYGVIENKPENFVVSTGFTTLRVNQNLAVPEYVYYYLTQDYITEYLQNIAQQNASSYPSIKPKHIGELDIKLPSLEIQKT